MNNYTVYKHTTPNGKVYIGITNQSTYSRWQKDGRGYKNAGIFRNAIRKYGWDNIEHTVIATGLSEEMAAIAERKLIKHYRSTDRRFGYNLQCGGNLGWKGRTHSDATKERMRLLMLGENNPMYGKHLTEEHKLKISMATKGKKKSEETRRKMSEAQSHRSKETIERLRAAQKKKPVVCVELCKTYESLSEACRQTGISPGNLSACCKKRKKTCGGFHWEYA